MSNLQHFRLTWLLLAAIGVVGPTTAALAAGETSRMDVFNRPDGTSAFALSLTPGAVAAGDASPRSLVIVVDTSASAMGDYRTAAIRVVNGLLQNLAAQDRVCLMAGDLDATALTGFVAPQSVEMAQGLQKLDARTPLGSTDMEKVLTTVAASFAGGPAGPRTAIYIGQGRSPANIMPIATFAGLAKQLAGARIPVCSYAVGVRPDLQVLGALAAHTGGMLLTDETTPDATQIAARLAAAAHATVLWPTAVIWPAAMTEVFPKDTPPLRSDRDSVVLGTLKGSGPMEVKMTVDVQGAAKELSWSVQPGTSVDENSYLAQLVDVARGDGGASLPIAGSASLRLARQSIDSSAASFTQMAMHALSSGNVADAEHLADAALRLDPHNPDALNVKHAAVKRVAAVASVANGSPLPVPPTAGNVPPPPPEAPTTGDLNLSGSGQFAESVERQQSLLAQAIQADIQTAINEARRQMSTDPAAAIQGLKLAQERLRQSRDIMPGLRQQLNDLLQGALREGSRRLVEDEQRQQMRHEAEAAAKERQLVNEGLARNQEKVKQLMERFDALMLEGRYRLAEEGPAAEVTKLAPDLAMIHYAPMTVAAVEGSRMTGTWHAMQDVKIASYKGYLDTMMQVEKSHVPFPDDPPIVYPPAAEWQRLTAERREKYQSMDLASRNDAEKNIDKALHSPTQLEFTDTPLSDVLEFLKDYHKIEIQLDKKALDDVGIAADVPITRNLKGITLRSALRLMLKELGLTYVISEEVLLITTPEQAESRLVTKVYPVADLVIPIRTPAVSGMSGLGGGMGSSMMGGGGGGGGGMGGGMGGGGGGMGGGGMGGGMFNIPEMMMLNRLQQNGMLPQIPAGGMNAFCVKDDLNLTGEPARPATLSVERPTQASATAGSSGNAKGTAEQANRGTTPHTGETPVAPGQAAMLPGQAPAAAAAAGEVAKPHRIQIEMEAGADPNVAWEKYFASHHESPGAVRDAVRRLNEERNFNHVIALINAALRHRQGQPWMYEGLALAMQMAGRPSTEVERALMSAADFAQNSTELLYLAVYLSENGFDARAIKMFRQVAALDPVRSEPYVLGLKLAQRTNDVAAIEWASLGILRRGWPKEQQETRKDGERAAEALLEKLKTEKRTAEFNEFQQAVKEARVRDCALAVTWTGEGEVDLYVQEPTGTVCSFRSPRSAAGGMLLGDTLAKSMLPGGEGHSQVYVCPEGFSGGYKLLARRVWGKITSDKVNVLIYTHFGSKDQKVIQQRVALEKDELVVAFNLDRGRRKESLTDQQVAAAVAGQVAIGQQILAQQLAAAVDPQALAAAAVGQQNLADVSSGATTTVGGGAGTGTEPVFGFMPIQGAVGYQPIIITLPSGANTQFSAVVSADRRYVRITVLPMFSSIPSVHTFNYVSGSGGTTGGATSGGSTGF